LVEPTPKQAGNVVDEKTEAAFEIHALRAQKLSTVIIS
jgi:hypothetical protein